MSRSEQQPAAGSGDFAAAEEDRGSSRVFLWGLLIRGDCRQENGRLEIRDNGTASFSCVTWTTSTNSGDYWWAGFHFYDGADNYIHVEAWRPSPEMDERVTAKSGETADSDRHPQYQWGFDFTFNPAIYSRIAKIEQSCRC
jgi:hypothetical protein